MGHFKKPRLAKAKREKEKNARRDVLIEKENQLAFLVEDKRLTEQECEIMDAFKAQYMYLRARGLSFTGKYYNKYITWRNEILDKYYNDNTTGSTELLENQEQID